MFVIFIVDLRLKEMNGINPGEMAGSLDAEVYQGGYVNITESQPVNNLSITDAFGDFNKQELLEKVSRIAKEESLELSSTNINLTVLP